MKTISRVAAAFLVSASMLAAAQAQQCRPGVYTVCGPCDPPCYEPYWAGMMGDSMSSGDHASLSPATLVQIADTKPDYPKKSKREAVKPLNAALQQARFDARGRLVYGEKEIRNAIKSLRHNTSDPLVGFIAPNVSSDPKVNARIQTLNRLFVKASKERITLY